MLEDLSVAVKREEYDGYEAEMKEKCVARREDDHLIHIREPG